MPNLGNKHECYSCGAKFYDLGKSEALCPKCGANQKDASRSEQEERQAARKRRREEREEEAVIPADDEAGPAVDFDEEIAPVAHGEVEEVEEDLDDEA